MLAVVAALVGTGCGSEDVTEFLDGFLIRCPCKVVGGIMYEADACGDPGVIDTQGEFAAKCQDACNAFGANLSFLNFFTGEFDSPYAPNPGFRFEPFFSDIRCNLDDDPGKYPGTDEFIATSNSRIDVSLQGHSATSLASGSISLTTPDCTTYPCEVALTDLFLSGEDLSIEGISISGVKVSNANIWYGVIDANGKISFPATNARLNGQLIAHGKRGSDSFAPNEAVTGTYDSQTGAIAIDGYFAGTNGAFQLSFRGSSQGNRAPRISAFARGDLTCDPLTGTAPVILDASGSSDPDGTTFSVSWHDESGELLGEGTTVQIELPPSSYSVAATAQDPVGKAALQEVSFQVNDMAPPVLTAPTNTQLEACSSASTQIEFPTPDVTDLCSGAELTGHVISINGTSVGPIALLGNTATVPPGTTVVEWTATKPNGVSTSIYVEYIIVARPVLRASEQLTLADRAKILVHKGAQGLVLATGTQTTELGVDSQLGSLHSVPSVLARERAFVDGYLTTGGQFLTQNGVSVSGAINGGASAPAASAPVLSGALAPSSNSVSLEPSMSDTLVAGQYGNLIVKAGATLILNSGEYAFANVQIEPGATVQFVGRVVAWVHGDVTYRGIQSGALPIFHFPNASQVFLESSFNGIIRAPQGDLILGNDNNNVQLFRGEFFARRILVRADMNVLQDSFDCGE